MEYEREVTWKEDVHDDPPPGSGRLRGDYLGQRTLRGTVKVEIDLEWIARYLGRKALKNKSKKSVDGPITVKVVRPVTEVSRDVKPPVKSP